MKIINRSAVIVKPKKPFLEWLNGLPSEEKRSLDDIRDECTVFLIPEYDMAKEAKDFIKRNFKTIFRIELEGWHTDPKDVPEKLTYKMFKEWFECEISSEIVDLSPKILRVEEF